MPSVQWGATPSAKLTFTPLSSALADLSNGAGTIALLWRPVIFSTLRCDGTTLTDPTGATPYMGLSLGDTGTGQWSADDGVAWIVSSSTPAFGDWYISVIDWPAVAGKARFHWKDLTTAAAWVHQDSVANNQNAKGGPGSGGRWTIGNGDGGGCGSGAQFAVVAAWNVRLGDTNAALLSASLRTSDWYANPAGAPVFLSEITSLAPSDLIGGSTFSAASSTTTNLTVGGEPAGGWLFNGLGVSHADAPAGRLTVAGSVVKKATRAGAPRGTLILGGRTLDAWATRNYRDTPAAGVTLASHLAGSYSAPVRYVDTPVGALTLSAGQLVEFNIAAAPSADTPSGTLVLAGRAVEKAMRTDASAGNLTFPGRAVDAWATRTQRDTPAAGAILVGRVAESYTAAIRHAPAGVLTLAGSVDEKAPSVVGVARGLGLRQTAMLGTPGVVQPGYFYTGAAIWHGPFTTEIALGVTARARLADGERLTVAPSVASQFAAADATWWEFH